MRRILMPAVPRVTMLVVSGALLIMTPIAAQQQEPPPPVVTPAPQAEATPAAAARVTYVTGSSVYIDAGRDEGLHEGDTVEVIRDGAPIATLKVVFLSEHRASCSIVSASVPPAVGDTARYRPRLPAAAAGAAGEPAGTAAARPRGGWTGGLHGRAGVRYLFVRDTGGGENGFTQPSADLRMDGYGLGGSGFDVNVDIRARQTYRDWPGSEDQRLNRVYRLSTSYHLPNTRQRITVGRQAGANLETVSIFDGVLWDLTDDRWGAGVFTGTQPDPTDSSLDGTVREYGGYYLVKSLPPEARQWSVAFGLVDSYAESEVNRTWFYLQGRYRGPRLSGFLTQEIDYNRSWKVSEAGESTIDPTSTFASLHYQASDRITLRAGYDNRRNIRLWLDRVNPVTVFDDSHRQGGWAGASFRIGDHCQLGADGRVSTGGPSGRADGYSGSLGWTGIGGANFGFDLRTTRYTNDRSDGWMHALGAGWNMGRRAHLDLAAGHVEETDEIDPALDRTDDWYGIDLDVLIARRWFLILSMERYTGTFQDNDQGYAAITYRF